MTDPVLVRPATAVDLPDILEIDRQSAEAPHWSEAIYAARLSVFADMPVPVCLFVAEVAGVVAGYGAARVVAGEAELETVAVANASRRRGAGRELCLAMIEWARMAGARSMDLEVRSRSMVPQHLYGQLGFRRTGRRPFYYSGPEDDAVLMRLDLGRSGETGSQPT